MLNFKAGLLSLNPFRSRNIGGASGKPKPTPGPEGSVSNLLKPQKENKAFADVVAEMDCDYQIQFMRHILVANLQAIDVSVSVENGDGEKSEALQDRMQKLWDRTVPDMVAAVGYGRVAFEKSWDYDEKARLTLVESLEPLEFKKTRLRLDEEKCYDGFDLNIGDGDENWKPIKRRDSWWLALDETVANPHGRSQYKGAVERAWRRKQANLRNLDLYSKRFAIRGGVAHGPLVELDERTGLEISVVEMMTNAANALWSGGMMYLPNDAHPDQQMAGKYKYDFTEASAQMLDPAPLLAIIAADDVAILRAAGIPEKAAIEGDGGGSYAMLTQQMLTLFARIDGLMAQFVHSFEKYVLKPWRDANYGEGDGPEFKLHFVKLTNRPDSFVVTLLTALVANPAFAELILSGGVDLRQMLEKVGLPVTAELEQVAKQAAAQFAATKAAAGGPGMPVPGDGAAAPAQGEFQNSSRLQWSRNVKAIRDVLADLATQKSTPAFAQHMLESIGMSPERATALIEEVSGANPGAGAPEAVTMANVGNRGWQYYRTALIADAASALTCPFPRVLTFHCGTGAGGFKKGNHCWKQTHHLTKEHHRSRAKAHGIAYNETEHQKLVATQAEADRLHETIKAKTAAGAPKAELKALQKKHAAHLAEVGRIGTTAFLTADRIHRARVQAAVNRGHYVPDEVLDQYPLQKKLVNARRSVADAARRHGHAFGDVQRQMPDSYAILKEEHTNRELAKSTARQVLDTNAPALHRMEDAGLDYSSVPGWDTGARTVAIHHPELGIDPDSGEASKAVWELIKEGKREHPRPDGSDVAEHAAQTLTSIKESARRAKLRKKQALSAPRVGDSGFDDGTGDAFEDEWAPVSHHHDPAVPFSNRLRKLDGEIRGNVEENAGILQRQQAAFKAFLAELGG